MKTVKVPNGGSAFPIAGEDRTTGMSLRDYFAAHALAAVLTARAVYKIPMSRESLAEESYALADALLVAREKTAEDDEARS